MCVKGYFLCFFNIFIPQKIPIKPIKIKKQVHSRVPANFKVIYQFLVSEQMNSRFGFINNSQIVIV